MASPTPQSQGLRWRATLSLGLGVALCQAKRKDNGPRPDLPTPTLPFCRKGHTASIIRLPENLLESERGTPEYRMVVFGGKGHDWTVSEHGSSFLNDMWALHVTNDAFAWKQITPRGDVPETRWKSAMAGGNASQVSVLFGGDHEQSAAANNNDTWFYFPRQNTWRPLPPVENSATPPLPRRSHVVVETPAGELIVHGGKYRGHQCLNDVKILTVAYGAWELSGTRKPTWKNGADFPEKCRWGAAATIFITRRHDDRRRLGSTRFTRRKDKYNLHPKDAKNMRTVMAVFGGRRKRPDNVYHYYDELWFYYVQEDRWALVQPRGSVRPPARDHHSLDYIYDTHSLYMYGGRFSEERTFDSVASDLWVIKLNENPAKPASGGWPEGDATKQPDLQVGHWHKIEPAGLLPRARFLHTGVVWYGGMGDGHGALVVFGGEHIKRSGANPKLNDAWMYSPILNSWREVSANGCRPGASGVSKQPLMDMRFFEFFAAGVLILGLSFFCYQRRHGQSGYQSIEEEDEDNF